jgi:RNA polymerase sigma-70 factor (ECF subfamily)
MAKNHESLQSIALNFVENKDNSSYTKLINRLKPGLQSYVYKYIKDKDICNEVLSQTFITVWEKIEQYKPVFNFSTWVYTIARNEALGQIRGEKRYLSHEKLTENHSKVLQMYSPIVNMETEVIGPTGEDLIQQLYDASISAIKQLKEPYKTVMIEREINQKQLQTIADDLGWNSSTVKTRLRKARKEIAETIKKQYPDLVDAYSESY